MPWVWLVGPKAARRFEIPNGVGDGFEPGKLSRIISDHTQAAGSSKTRDARCQHHCRRFHWQEEEEEEEAAFAREGLLLELY
jgi:hypothetical protein